MFLTLIGFFFFWLVDCFVFFNADWYGMLPDRDQRIVNNKSSSRMDTHHALLHCSRQWPISMCHSVKKKAQWYILAPTAKHLPERQAAGLEQSHGRNAISLRKKKKSQHIFLFWQPRENRQLYRIKQQVHALRSWDAKQWRSSPYYCAKPLLTCAPRGLALTDFCCKKENILTVFLW